MGARRRLSKTARARPKRCKTPVGAFGRNAVGADFIFASAVGADNQRLRHLNGRYILCLVQNACRRLREECLRLVRLWDGQDASSLWQKEVLTKNVQRPLNRGTHIYHFYLILQYYYYFSLLPFLRKHL